MGNFYRLLGLRKDATDEEIKAAYKKLALTHNPKRKKPKPSMTPSEHAQEQMMREQAEELESLQIFMLTAEAYDILSDPLRRAIYDQYGERALKEGFPGPDGFIDPYVYHGDPYRTFREFFGTDNPFVDLLKSSCAPMDYDSGKSSASYLPKGARIMRPLPLTLEEVYRGAVKKLIVSKKVLKEDGVTTETVNKVLTVKIPPGTPHGMQFSFPGEGDQGCKIQPADVCFVAEIQPHPDFEREGDNLVMTAKLTLGESLCGSKIPVKTLDGRFFTVMSVHMIYPGSEKVIAGEGLPLLGEPERKGDLLIRFNVKYPNKLSDKQRQALKDALTAGPDRKMCPCPGPKKGAKTIK